MLLFLRIEQRLGSYFMNVNEMFFKSEFARNNSFVYFCYIVYNTYVIQCNLQYCSMSWNIILLW